jgi:outer membrane receptor protein involved in Fe transport
VHETDPRDGHSFVSPRAQAHYRAGSKWVLGVAAGRGIVGPRPSFAETCCGAKYQRNLGLPPERAWSYQLRAEWHPTPDQRLTVTGFWTDFTDYQEKVVYKVSAYIPYYSNRALDEARVRGVDLVHDLRFRGNRWNVGWSYTWTDADGTYTWDTPPPPWHQDAAGWRPWSVGGVRYVPEHAASAFVRYDHPTRGTKWSLSITHKGAVSHFLLSEGRDEWDQWELLRSESFTTVDASFEQRVGRRGWSVLGGVNNVTDYSMPDLGEPESSFDWGPITGRFFFAGAKFER